MLAAQPLATGRLDPDHRSLTSPLPGLNAKDDDSTPWSPARSIVERASGSAPIDEFLLHSSCVFHHQAVPLRCMELSMLCTTALGSATGSLFPNQVRQFLRAATPSLNFNVCRRHRDKQRIEKLISRFILCLPLACACEAHYGWCDLIERVQLHSHDKIT